MKKTLLLLAFIAISLTGYAQTDNLSKVDFDSDYLVVRTFEVPNNMVYSSKIFISDGKSEVEIIDIKGIKDKHAASNFKKIVKTLNSVKDRGYILVNTNSGGGHQIGYVFTNYIFQKRLEE